MVRQLRKLNVRDMRAEDANMGSSVKRFPDQIWSKASGVKRNQMWLAVVVNDQKCDTKASGSPVER